MKNMTSFTCFVSVTENFPGLKSSIFKEKSGNSFCLASGNRVIYHAFIIHAWVFVDALDIGICNVFEQ